MSLQWTIVATFLYVEIALIILMLLSIIRPQFWRSLFQSRFMSVVAAQSNLYIIAFLGILLLFFVESIREFHKYSNKLNNNDRMYVGSSAFYEDQMRVFRGQRNFYISGFALLCVFIIKRLVKIYSDMSQLKAEADASIRQARNAAEMASQNIPNLNSGDEWAEEKKALKKIIQELEVKLKKAEIDKKAMEQQSKNLHKSYEEIAEKLSKLESTGESAKDK